MNQIDQKEWHICHHVFYHVFCAEDLGVPLMDFAKWVGHLKPGRIIYASPNASADWDLILRLNWSRSKSSKVDMEKQTESSESRKENKQKLESK